MLRKKGAFFMPDDKDDIGKHLDEGVMGEVERTALLKAIQREVDTMSQEELERLYAAIAFMEKKKDK
jgi:hypothetical protein